MQDTRLEYGVRTDLISQLLFISWCIVVFYIMYCMHLAVSSRRLSLFCTRQHASERNVRQLLLLVGQFRAAKENRFETLNSLVTYKQQCVNCILSICPDQPSILSHCFKYGTTLPELPGFCLAKFVVAFKRCQHSLLAFLCIVCQRWRVPNLYTRGHYQNKYLCDRSLTSWFR